MPILLVLCPIMAMLSLAWLAVHMFNVMRGQNGIPHASQWSKQVRDDLRPIRDAFEAIESSISRGAASTAVRVLGKEALPEAKKLLQFAYRTAQRREEMQALIRTASRQEQEAARLELRLSSASSEEERRSLENSIANYRKLQSKVGMMNEGLASTDTQLREAHAALLELQSQIVVAGTSASVATETDELRETLGRIRDLSRSFEEVDQTLEQRLHQ